VGGAWLLLLLLFSHHIAGNSEHTEAAATLLYIAAESRPWLGSRGATASSG
jgi:hypothetical protein